MRLDHEKHRGRERDRRAVAVVLVTIVLFTASCASTGPDTRVVGVDRFGPAVERRPVCDLGILRLTGTMYCDLEFNRKVWFHVF